ncbi:hypothetical protein O181_130397 [Austropuccinia psidii MF-1]|uniref:Uncharacterized protein n=1 Tax=Austropuccinia psidii MF-1 TaxID=1389203 RepID=A0A9Q3L139_9BASI|nr:hypothetical protein [Austropuccinia psidii MF-1]
MFVSCMELVTCPNECFVQVGFRNWPLHMRMSHTYVPTHAHAHSTATTHASASAPTPNPTAQAPTPTHAHTPAQAPTHAHTPAQAPTHTHVVLRRGLYQCHPQNVKPAEAESFHG